MGILEQKARNCERIFQMKLSELSSDNRAVGLASTANFLMKPKTEDDVLSVLTKTKLSAASVRRKFSV
jgi:hypothetical protein